MSCGCKVRKPIKVWIVIKEILVAIAALVAIFATLLGFSAWRRESAAKVEYGLAKDMLKTLYGIRDAAARIRDPFMVLRPPPDINREQWLEFDEKERRWRSTVLEYENRWRPVEGLVKDLEALKLEAEVVWGPDFRLVLDPLRTSLRGLSVAIHEKLDHGHPDRAHDYDHERVRKLDSIVYVGGKPAEDDWLKGFNQAIESIEDRLRPPIRRFHTRFQWRVLFGMGQSNKSVCPGEE